MKTKCFSLLFIFFLCKTNVHAETFPTGSYIINMGVTPQTVANGMKPYGLVYEFLKTYNVPVRWVIGAGKLKDSADFTYNGTKYRGGTFIIPKQYISTSVKTRITYWKGQGVVMDSTTSSLTVTVTRILTSAPKWTLSTSNTSIAAAMFTHASIPSSAYNTNAPATLGVCDDIFAMPHADPTWALHGNLYTWNRTNKGAIWANCHAISVMESLVNPSVPSERLNFLSTQGLINYGSHADGTPGYQYFFNRASYNGAPINATASDPVFQMMGTEDAAHTNGSEQIYIPVSGAGSGWRNTTKIGCYDSTQSNVSAFPNGPAAVTLYGRGYGLSSAGYVMYQSGHNITGTAATNISAMRQFFNFSFMAMEDKVPAISASSIASSLNSNSSYTFSVSASSPVSASLSYQWTSSGGGTFSNSTSASTTFNTGTMPSDSSFTATCVVTDACGRATFLSTSIQIMTALPVKLVSFDAALENTDVNLYWSSASEEGMLGYDIERSVDGESFYPVASIHAMNNTDPLNEYKYTDRGFQDANHRILYYRLKMIDLDGKYSYSPVVEINLASLGTGIVSLVPNPSSDIVLIELQTSFSAYASLEINDVYGRTVFSTDQPEMMNSHTIRLDIHNFTNGVYFVNLRKKSGEYNVGSFIKN